MSAYLVCKSSEIPNDVRFDVPAHCQGQIVEVAYGDRGAVRSENSDGAPWKRITDKSIAVGKQDRVTYYRRADLRVTVEG